MKSRIPQGDLSGRCVNVARAGIFSIIRDRGMAHDMMLEAGWQAVADRIAAWLAQRGL